MKFTELDLHPDLLKGIQELGFVECTPVQDETFKHTLHEGDVIVQSQTGTGKTAAFLITIFQQLLTNPKYRGRKAMVIVPTRELADQIYDDARAIGKYVSVTFGAFFGGVGYHQQESLLAKGVDLYIGTPGRLIDFGQTRKIDFRSVGLLVIDEADRLFDMGFFPDIKRMLRQMPPREKRLTMLLSATISTRVGILSWEHMNDPAQIVIQPEQVTVDGISQHLFHVSRAEKTSVLLGVLSKWKPRNVLIFTNMKRTAEELAQRLRINGYSCEFIIGDLPQNKRLTIIDDLKSGAIQILVATDVAARGLHVDDLDMVVNYDIPEDAENYVHRIGRTARAGKSGTTIALACERYVYGLEAIEKFIGRKIPVEPVADDMFVEDKSAGMRIRTTRYDDRDEKGRPGGRGRPGQRGGTRGRDRGDGGAPGARRDPAARRGAEGQERPGKPKPAGTRGGDTRKGDRGGDRRAGARGRYPRKEGAAKDGNRNAAPSDRRDRVGGDRNSRNGNRTGKGPGGAPVDRPTPRVKLVPQPPRSQPEAQAGSILSRVKGFFKKIFLRDE